MVEGLPPALAERAVIGRERELDHVRAFLDDSRRSPSALLLDGPAGIGKTTIWDWGLAETSGSHRVLRCRAAEAEATLSFAGLVDLLAGVEEEAMAALPEPQHRAIRVALLREPPTGESDQLALPLALMALLHALANDRPTVLAVDDLHWLDSSTADLLAFAVRRVHDAPLRIFLSRRTDGVRTAPLGLDRALPPDRFGTLHLEPLSAGGIALLVQTHLSASLPRPTVLALHRASGGNPFYALEIARSVVVGRARIAADGSLPVPESLKALVGRRLDGLSPSANDAVLLVAVGSHPSARIVEAAAGSTEGLDEAIRAGILKLHEDRVSFAHPLLGSVARDRALPWDRREAHRRLAEVVDDPEGRAVHAALASDEHDEERARELDDAGRLAAARGAADVAAWMAEQAARFTPRDAPRDRVRRLLAAADHHHASGDPDRARGILRSLRGEVPPGPDRAEVLWRLSSAGGQDAQGSMALCREALEEAGADASLRARIHLEMATHAWTLGELAASAEYVRGAVVEAEETEDPVLLASALGELAHAETVLGRGLPRAAIDRAIELEGSGEGFPIWFRPSLQLGILLTYTDQIEEARPLLLAELERCTSAGDEAGRAGVLFRLTELEFRAGNWDRALAHAQEGRSLAEQASVDQELSVILAGLGLITAHLGMVDETREAAAQSLAYYERAGDVMGALRNRGTLGFLELSLGHPAEAHEHLGPATERLLQLGVGEFSISQVVHNEVEALVALGGLDEAERMVELMDGIGRPVDRAWSLAMAARGRAMISAARGQLDDAVSSVEEALRHHARLAHPFERGRTHLVRGAIQRRAKRWGEARRSLEEAVRIFDELGARLWVDKARAELSRVGGRRPTPLELTETERQVAELVASGRSTRETAAALFLSPKTVSTQLTRIYRKLGVRSRSELAARLGSHGSVGESTPRPD